MKTIFLLLAEFGQAHVTLEAVAERYLGLDSRAAKARAARGELPFPAFRAGSQKSPWMVSVQDLSDWLDKERAKAAEDWHKRQAV